MIHRNAPGRRFRGGFLRVMVLLPARRVWCLTVRRGGDVRSDNRPKSTVVGCCVTRGSITAIFLSQLLSTYAADDEESCARLSTSRSAISHRRSLRHATTCNCKTREIARRDSCVLYDAERSCSVIGDPRERTRSARDRRERALEEANRSGSTFGKVREERNDRPVLDFATRLSRTDFAETR